MSLLRTKIYGGLLFCLNRVEFKLNKLLVYIRSQVNGALEKNCCVANNPEKWEKMYLSNLSPVVESRGEIAKTIIELTRKNETLLETGCGSGVISAELSIAGRSVSVCDFSKPILERVERLFRISGLNTPGVFLVDLTRPLPFKDNQFDVVWNSGVLEHWTDEELKPIIHELARCAKRCVISLVPNEKSVFYRYGRESAEMHGIAPWGREIPRSSLRKQFEYAGLINVEERTICVSDGVWLISIIDPVFGNKIQSWWNSIPDTDPVKNEQGYLLLTVGYKQVLRV